MIYAACDTRHPQGDSMMARPVDDAAKRIGDFIYRMEMKQIKLPSTEGIEQDAWYELVGEILLAELVK